MHISRLPLTCIQGRPGDELNEGRRATKHLQTFTYLTISKDGAIISLEAAKGKRTQVSVVSQTIIQFIELARMKTVVLLVNDSTSYKLKYFILL